MQYLASVLFAVVTFTPWTSLHAEDLTAADEALREKLPQQTKTYRLWPNGAPDEAKEIPAEEVSGGRNGDQIMRIGNVARPTIHVTLPQDVDQPTAAVVVCPGGGYNILAAEHEGTEICDALLKDGIATILLKYRVPRRGGEFDKHHHALQDAQRAVSLVRANAKQWNIDPQQIGVLGFSAGGHLTATLTNNHAERAYDKIDAADDVSCRPDFAVLIYPAYLTVSNDTDRLDPLQQMDQATTERTCPTFLAVYQNDPFAPSSLYYFAALRAKKIPAELHIYEGGRHGTGLREAPFSRWMEDLRYWLARRKVIDDK